MMMSRFIPFLFLLIGALVPIAAQNVEKDRKTSNLRSTDYTIGEWINGVLTAPDQGNGSLVIMIGGQGVVDRNGNEMRTKTNHLQQLADSLKQAGIASYRYDKRTVALIKARKPVSGVLFSTFVADARQVVKHFKTSGDYEKIILLGHGQGSLVAMLVAKEADALISIAGAGQSIDDLIVQQIAQDQPGLDKIARETFDKVKRKKKPVKKVEPILQNIIGPEIQPFMKSWMKYNPSAVIKTIKSPILLINGELNRQVAVAETQRLAKAVPTASLRIIEDMNYTMKQVDKDPVLAAKSYIDPNFTLHPELLEAVIGFCQ